MITISKDSDKGVKPNNTTQGKPTQLKTDQEILDEIRRGNPEQPRRNVGLTAFVILLAIVIAVFTAVNANRENFETGVRDMSQAEAEYPGWLRRLLTHPVKGLDSYRELFDHLHNPGGAIKIYCEVS